MGSGAYKSRGLLELKIDAAILAAAIESSVTYLAGK